MQIETGIKHFYYRAGFGLGLKDIQMLRSNSIGDLIDYYTSFEFVDTSEARSLDPPDPLPADNFLEARHMMMPEPDIREENLLEATRNRWIYDMVHSDQSMLHEKMTLFWHHHFACQCLQNDIAIGYLKTIRKNALGNFRELLHGISKTPAMLIFLNNQQNRKNHPNENFARELMELFTLGEGNYTEADIKEAARAFTGWSTASNLSFLFREKIHDDGTKVFLGRQGNLNGDDIIDIILDREETPFFLARKLYEFFVSHDPDEEAVRLIAQEIRKHDYEIKPVMRFIFNSAFFSQQGVIGNRIKSPIELIVHVLRLTKLNFKDPYGLTFLQIALGQQLFYPPNVSGWTGGKAWINNATLMLRLNFANYLINGERFDHASSTPLEAMQANHIVQTIAVEYDLEPLQELLGGIPYENLEKTLKQMLLAVPALERKISSKRDQRQYDYSRMLILRLLSLPEFQLC